MLVSVQITIQSQQNLKKANYRINNRIEYVDINTRIEDQLKSNNILLYMKGTPDFPQCGFSGQAIAALKAIGQPFSYVNIFEDQEVREGLKALLRLANVSSALCERGVGRWMRYHDRDVSFW